MRLKVRAEREAKTEENCEGMGKDITSKRERNRGKRESRLVRERAAKK